MNKSRFKSITVVIMLLFIPVLSFSQVYNEDDDRVFEYSNKGFHAGLYLGSYFPNSNPATLYDGYGYNADKEKNSFQQSWMYQNINFIYGGYGNNGAPDYIAEALGVQHEDWKFDNEDYMPVNMRYKTVFSVGFCGKYSVDGQNGVIINVTGAILKAAGNFTIYRKPPPNSTQINDSYYTGNISGEEQRLLIQAGYQALLGKGGGMHFILEGGLHATLAQYVKNEIQINDLIINLNQDYYDPVNGYTFFTGSKPVGLGFGAFAGLGLHFQTNSQWNFQIIYNPVLDNVRIGYDPKLSLSHQIGIRLYYKLKKIEIPQD